ncbi:hypothetical protein Q7269_10520 [Glaesserella parasuis]|nr:hypothetical protein [Glaesserella parasuis]MDP0314328.1 hypothetical protein [Glaesserella parasuis]
MKTLLKVLMTTSLVSIATINTANAEMMDDCKNKMRADCQTMENMKHSEMKKNHMMKSDDMKKDGMMKSDKMKKEKM